MRVAALLVLRNGGRQKLAEMAARAGLTPLRGIGIRLGEMLDLELDCVWTHPSKAAGSRCRWASLLPGGPCRLTPPPWPPWTNGSPSARNEPCLTPAGPARRLLFTERGKQPTAWRLRRGLDDAASAAWP
jgi:hypothetical protein